jgi:hypothetical protein
MPTHYSPLQEMGDTRVSPFSSGLDAELHGRRLAAPV